MQEYIPSVFTKFRWPEDEDDDFEEIDQNFRGGGIFWYVVKYVSKKVWSLNSFKLKLAIKYLI